MSYWNTLYTCKLIMQCNQNRNDANKIKVFECIAKIASIGIELYFFFCKWRLRFAFFSFLQLMSLLLHCGIYQAFIHNNTFCFGIYVFSICLSVGLSPTRILNSISISVALLHYYCCCCFSAIIHFGFRFSWYWSALRMEFKKMHLSMPVPYNGHCFGWEFR